MDQAAHHETELEQQRELARIYDEIVGMNITAEIFSSGGLCDEELALIRRAFGLNQERAIV